MAKDDDTRPATDGLGPGVCEVKDWRHLGRSTQAMQQAMHVECCRCGKEIVGFYWLAENASPVHWDCLSEAEQKERSWEVPS